MNLIQLSQSNIWQRFWQLQQSRGIKAVLTTTWSYFWLRFSGLGYWGRIATWLATWLAPPYKMRRSFARYYATGYISPSATINHADLQVGANIFIGDRVKIFEDRHGGSVKLADRVYLHNDNCIQTGDGGSLKIGADTHIQPRCQFWAYQGLIQIGCGVQIAPSCAFYLGDGHISADELIKNQSLPTKPGIIVDDDAWLGHGVVVLDGIRIGKGAVIGSGAVVNQDIADGAIAIGVPVRIIGMRSNLV
jgi:acetyltransferase-like isoleucine patch superfamily enzyme